MQQVECGLPDPTTRVRTVLTILEGSPHSSRTEWSPEEGRAIKTAIVLIPGGCYWARVAHGGEPRGCTYCNFEPLIDAVTEGTRFRPEDHVEMVRGGLAEVADGADKICIFTGGSFAPRDIPVDGLLGMVDLVREHPTARHLLVESRPELLSADLVRELAARLGGKRLEIAVGFETQNDEIRNGRPGSGLNKGIPRDAFERFVAMLRGNGVISSVYVMLKPYEGMSEMSGLTECLDTVDFVFRAGGEKVLLQATFPQESAKELALAWRRGSWTPPTYASIAHVLVRMARHGPIMLGAFDDIPPPLALPAGCDVCTDAMTALFEEYRRTLDPGVFQRAPECVCKRTWKIGSGTMAAVRPQTP